MDFSKADLVAAITVYPVRQQQRPVLSPHTEPATGMISQLPGDRFAAAIMKGAAFCPYWNNTYFGYGFAFPVCNASAKTLICEFTERFILVIHRSETLLLMKELTSQENKCSNESMILVFTDLCFPSS